MKRCRICRTKRKRKEYYKCEQCHVTYCEDCVHLNDEHMTLTEFSYQLDCCILCCTSCSTTEICKWTESVNDKKRV